MFTRLGRRLRRRSRTGPHGPRCRCSTCPRWSVSMCSAAADEIVSVHLSGEISGTWESAVLAAQEVGPDRVRVVDSRSAAMGLGFAALYAARAAAAGATGMEVEKAAAAAAGRSKTLFV